MFWDEDGLMLKFSSHGTFYCRADDVASDFSLRGFQVQSIHGDRYCAVHFGLYCIGQISQDSCSAYVCVGYTPMERCLSDLFNRGPRA